MFFKPLWIPYYQCTISAPLSVQQALDRIQERTIAPQDGMGELLVAGQTMLTGTPIFIGDIPSHSFTIRQANTRIMAHGKPLNDAKESQTTFKVTFSIALEDLFLILSPVAGLLLLFSIYRNLGDGYESIVLILLAVFFGHLLLTARGTWKLNKTLASLYS